MITWAEEEGSVATRPERHVGTKDLTVGGTMLACFLLRDWYESGKSDHRAINRSPDRCFSNPVSPFHGEPCSIMSEQQKTAIVTGASQGIGAALVKAFAERGYGVVANSRTIQPSGFRT